jgi:hypothetical protein
VASRSLLGGVQNGASEGSRRSPFRTLTELREGAGLSSLQLARGIVQRFGIAPGYEPRAHEHLLHLESGELDAARVSPRLVEALGDLLDADLTSHPDPEVVDVQRLDAIDRLFTGGREG